MRYAKNLLMAVTFVALLPVDVLLAQKAANSTPIDPATSATFIKSHRGPILDVRMDNDCAEAASLKQTTARIGFDFGPDNADGKKMAQDLFMSRVNANRTLATAKKNKSTVLVVCCAGGRSEAAAQLLAQNGYKVAHVPGGTTGEKFPAGLLKSK